jgi:archaeosine synthase beta-subunit
LSRGAAAFADREIRAARGPKESLDPRRPYAFSVEPELTASGEVEDVATVFLTNRECPFACLMCDLWRYTLDHSVQPGDILAQLDHAFERLPPVRHVKLYNAGNFFDAKAIPRSDLGAIAERLQGFETVIIENHPSLTGPAVREFAARLSGELEVAMGLETAHPAVLARLNKQLTLEGFRKACEKLTEWGIAIRTFVLLHPPFMGEAEGIHWARESVRLAFDAGSRVCTLIPTRAGNGIMERLQDEGRFEPPTLDALEEAHHQCLDLAGPGQRFFVDLWNAAQLPSCPHCQKPRIARLKTANQTQTRPQKPTCPGCPPPYPPPSCVRPE